MDRNVGHFLNNVVCGSFVKFQCFHHLNKVSSVLVIYAQSAYREGYTLDCVKINHLFFMDDLQLFAKIENEIDSVVSTVNLISQDIFAIWG